MVVTIGGKQYVIEGVAYGRVAAWKLIKQDGKPMTLESFNKLPDADKHSLAQHAQQYINSLSKPAS
jgi:hypothetical protein